MHYQDTFETSSDMQSLMTFYAQQQIWINSQLGKRDDVLEESLEEPPSPTLSTSSTAISPSPSRSPTPSSVASSSSPATKVRVLFGQTSSRHASICPQTTRGFHKWSSRNYPSSHPLRRLRTSKVLYPKRVLLWTRARRSPSRRSSSPPESPSRRLSSSPTPPATVTRATAEPSARATSPEALDLLVQYQAMIGDRLESCRRLQMMVEDEMFSGASDHW